ncbi:MAG: protein-methionine-sulfoxide reductase heme-binding subunit MsrQ [Rhodoferax sp.]
MNPPVRAPQAPLKPALALVLLAPLAYLVWAAAADRLGANPAQALVRATGDWSLRWLCLALAITPLRQGLGWPTLARLRRMVGLFAAAYVTLHALAYAGFDMGLDWDEIVRDIPKRPFVWVGFGAWLLLMLLAATSWDGAVRWLGGRRWQALHRSVYAVGLLALLHFYWMRAGKNDFAEVWVYAGVIALLLAWRVGWFIRKNRL